MLEATKDDVGAFIDQAKLNIDTGFRNLTNDLSASLFGNGSGTRGQMTSISGSGLITLTNANDIVNFEVGMALVSYGISGTTYTQSTSAAIGYVIGVDRSLGTVQVSATAGSTAGLPTNWSTSFPYLGVEGDVAFGSITVTTSFKKISGLGAWIPSTSPSDTFWGVDRSADPTRLGGNRFDGSGESIEEALIDGASLVNREGGRVDTCFLNFASWSALEKSLGSKVQYVEIKHDVADIAFPGIRVHSPYGPINCVADRSCTAQTAWLLKMDTWKLRSLNRAPHILTYGVEGLEGARVGDADALQVRLGFYGNLVCRAPGWNCRVSLSA